MSATDQREQPLVSVVIPTHNRAHCLGQSISSVLNQTYREIEVLVVDDCSTDGTDFLIRSFSDERLKYIKLETKSGSCVARNIGIKESQGSYIAFQDSDDEWLPSKLAIQVNQLQSSPKRVGLSYGKFKRINAGHSVSIPKVSTLPQGDVLKFLLRENFASTQVMLVRRECFEKVGLFDEKLKRFQDWELAIRIAADYDFCAINESLAIVYHSMDSITAKEKQYEALRYIFDKHEGLFIQDPVSYRLHTRIIGYWLYISDKPVNGRKYLQKSFYYANPILNKLLKRIFDFFPDTFIKSVFGLIFHARTIFYNLNGSIK